MKIDRAGIPFVGAAALVTLAAGWWGGWWTAVVLLPLTVFVVWFFRDPDRVAPLDAGLILTPADGRVIVATADKISVFMNVFNVHVCRSPHEGTVESVDHVSGRFLAAYRDDAAEHNERATITVASDAGFRLRFVLVAGLVARRIVCRVRPNQRLARGERVGLIRFGSRVDVLLPAGCEVRVRVGDRVVAGRSVVASRRPSDPAA